MEAPWKLPARSALAALALAAHPLAAQAPDSAQQLRVVGSAGEDRERVSQLVDGVPTAGFLIRSPSAGTESGGNGFTFLYPHARVAYNSGLPFSLNEEALWAGRGVGAVVTAGVRARRGRFTLTLAPEVTGGSNGEFQTVAPAGNPDAPLSRWASPFHSQGYTADLPHRFGDGANTTVTAGQSSLVMRAGRAAVGVATESQWWGPGARNGLVMSNNAPGFAHVFARTARPLRTAVGEFEGKWVLGSLRESDYFDARDSNNTRSLNGIVVAWRPRWEPSLTLGATRVVYATVDPGVLHLPARALDAAWRTGDRADQIFGFFGRWVFAPAGVELYGEWARQRGLADASHWLAEEGEPWAYTLGLQWARPTGPGGSFRLQAELSDLEKGAVERDRLPVRSYYTSDRVPQGYTHEGRSLGAAIGPGASSQWGAADYLGDRWELGLFGNRIRWENDAFYGTRRPLPTTHDVTFRLGVRGGLRTHGMAVRAELAAGRRLNYLFQSSNGALEDPQGVDLSNHTLRFSIEPFAR